MTRHSDLFTLLGAARSVLVAGHENPDGDSVGTTLAFHHLLTGRGIATTLYSIDPYPYNFLFLPGADRVIHRLPDEEPDLYVIVDAGGPQRVGEDLYRRLCVTRRPKFLFDHHVVYHDPGAFFDQTFLDDGAAATAVLVHRFMKKHGLPVTPEIALCLYAAVMADTGGMRYSATNREAFEMLAGLVEYVDPWAVAAQIWEEMPEGQVRLLGEAISSIRVLADGRAAVFQVTLEQMVRYGVGPDHIDSFINYARAIKGVEVAFRFRELAPGRYKASIRSKGTIDASRIANELGGGGHRNAAGFEFNGSFDDACALVENIVRTVTHGQ